MAGLISVPPPLCCPLQDYLAHIIDQCDLSIRPEQVCALFGNIEDIYEFNRCRRLLDTLTALTAPTAGRLPSLQPLPDTLLFPITMMTRVF